MEIKDETNENPLIPLEPAAEENNGQIAEPEPPDAAARIEEIFAAFVRSGPTGAERTAVCRFELDGEGGGSFVVRVAPEGVSLESENPDLKADITAALTVEDFLRIAAGNFDGELAVRSERIELSGDLELASALVDLVNHGDVLGVSRTSNPTSVE